MFSGPVIGCIEVVGNILDKLFTSDKEKLDVELAKQRLALNASEIQVEVNRIESSHRSIFVAGWRPFIGWVGGVSLLYAYLLYPVLSWVAAIWFTTLLPPRLVVDNLFELVLAMLGLGGLRTFEKVSGRTK